MDANLRLAAAGAASLSVHVAALMLPLAAGNVSVDVGSRRLNATLLAARGDAVAPRGVPQQRKPQAEAQADRVAAPPPPVAPALPLPLPTSAIARPAALPPPVAAIQMAAIAQQKAQRAMQIQFGLGEIAKRIQPLLQTSTECTVRGDGSWSCLPPPDDALAAPLRDLVGLACEAHALGLIENPLRLGFGSATGVTLIFAP